jgi:hypothetical protein
MALTRGDSTMRIELTGAEHDLLRNNIANPITAFEKLCSSDKEVMYKMPCSDMFYGHPDDIRDIVTDLTKGLHQYTPGYHRPCFYIDTKAADEINSTLTLDVLLFCVEDCNNWTNWNLREKIKDHYLSQE